MSIYRLDRFATCHFGTFGHFYGDGYRAYSLELPWLENRAAESCIPAGWYDFRRDTKGRHRYARILNPPPGRSDVEIHPANVSAELLGCIALGAELGWVADAWAITGSREACDRLLEEIGAETATHTLIIRWANPEQ